MENNITPLINEIKKYPDIADICGDLNSLTFDDIADKLFKVEIPKEVKSVLPKNQPCAFYAFGLMSSEYWIRIIKKYSGFQYFAELSENGRVALVCMGIRELDSIKKDLLSPSAQFHWQNLLSYRPELKNRTR